MDIDSGVYGVLLKLEKIETGEYDLPRSSYNYFMGQAPPGQDLPVFGHPLD